MTPQLTTPSATQPQRPGSMRSRESSERRDNTESQEFETKEQVGDIDGRHPTSGLGNLPSRPQSLPRSPKLDASSTYKSEISQGFKTWATDDPYHYPIPKKDDPWDECFKLVLKFDEEMCRGWREEIDTLLVFAGLFSAAVTAFTIESYTWLQPDPSSAQVQLLQSISSQLQILASNSSVEVQTFAQNQFTPGASSIRVNIFWFASLTLALISVLLGILCKQWLREYQRYEGLSAKDAFPVRHLRYEGLLGWHVPTILSSLPLLLQAALILFFSGLIDLLWTINVQVASIVSVLVGIALIFLVGTTIAPCVQNLIHLSTLWPSHYREPKAQCAFKSPQSWAFYLLVTWVISTYSQIKQRLFYGTALNYLQLQLNSWHSNDANWVKYDYRWQRHGKFMQRGILWFDKTFARGQYNVETIHNVHHCLASLDINISAECVSNIITTNWNPLVTLGGLLQPVLFSLYRRPMEEDDDIDPILARDLISAGYLIGHHKAGSTVSLFCLEQCSKMLNCPSLSKELSSVVLEILNIVAPAPVASQPELVTQLLTSMSALFDSNLISTDNVGTFWAVVTHIIRKTNDLNVNRHSRKALHGLLKHTENWLARTLKSAEVSIFEKQLSIQKCSAGILNIYRSLTAVQTARTFPGINSSPGTTQDGHEATQDIPHLHSIVLLIDGFLCDVGGPHLILSIMDMEVWNDVKQSFMQ